MKCKLCGFPLTLSDAATWPNEQMKWLHVHVTSWNSQTGHFEYEEREGCSYPSQVVDTIESKREATANHFVSQCYHMLSSTLSEHHALWSIYKQVPDGPNARFTLKIQTPRAFMTVHAKDEHAELILTNEEDHIKYIGEILPGDAFWTLKALKALHLMNA